MNAATRTGTVHGHREIAASLAARTEGLNAMTTPRPSCVRPRGGTRSSLSSRPAWRRRPHELVHGVRRVRPERYLGVEEPRTHRDRNVETNTDDGPGVAAAD